MPEQMDWLSPSIVASATSASEEEKQQQRGNNQQLFSFIDNTAVKNEAEILPFVDVVATTTAASSNDGGLFFSSVAEVDNVPLELDVFSNELEKMAAAMGQELEPLHSFMEEQDEDCYNANNSSSKILTSSMMEDASTDINEAFLNNLSVIQDPKMINSPDPAPLPSEQVDEEVETSTESLIEEMEAFLQQHEAVSNVDAADPENYSHAIEVEEEKKVSRMNFTLLDLGW